ncbi:hypothetical protein E2C01_019162 [Portunus trituberculatus]|uniref:Uncharacterized protein n=1 Tax=Portunus trituberculatus TaxID=210409 RepID=A0A5B7DYH6_PORTR|nr:hypothetical protein [Portunus trituberculatus]
MARTARTPTHVLPGAPVTLPLPRNRWVPPPPPPPLSHFKFLHALKVEPSREERYVSDLSAREV